MIKRCPICGRELILLEKKYFCPNDGFFNKDELEEGEPDETVRYIG